MALHAIHCSLNLLEYLKLSPSSVLLEDIIFSGTHNAVCPHREPHPQQDISLSHKVNWAHGFSGEKIHLLKSMRNVEKR